MSMASVAVQQSNAVAAAQAAATANATNGTSSSGTTSTGSTSSTTGSTALQSLDSNFSDFLGMLMTQLQNQDPTSPMDSNTFTTELVQFSGVEQQINTNSSLTQLIQLTQAGDVIQGTSMVGKQVTVQSAQVPLQSGKGTINFTAPAAEPVAITITNASGQQLTTAVLTSTQGQNTYTWNGTDSSGNTVADGAYNVVVEGANTDGTTTALPFTVTGTSTGVQNTNNTMELQLGALTVPFSAVQTVGN
jgi:flagellar basal-body rod modification protein FlgD